MSVHKKLTSNNYLSSKNFLNSGIVNMPRACIALVVVLRRIRTILGPMARLITIPARTITWWHLGVALPRSIL
jgi:hypothetical protein